MPGYKGKRLVDLLLLALSAPIWLPAVGILAVLVRARLGAPVFFRQQRAGRDGRLFEIVKFRSMTNARDPRGQLLPDADRLSPFGRMLRSTSLDELPELWNVLQGDMSLVGPRPLLPQYLERYSSDHSRRHDVAPGMTGLAQVSGRNALTWPARFDLDLDYIRRCAPALDLWILWRTALAVLRREGISAEGLATMAEFTGYDSPTSASMPPERGR
ncbi:MAG: sugar transferase [Gemmatimonadota bacterium]|nr:sugar transferase [Gemmatimonadota bacterium]